MGEVALDRMRELQNSLVPWGEQRFPSRILVGPPRLPRFAKECWNKKVPWDTASSGLAYPAPCHTTSLAMRYKACATRFSFESRRSPYRTANNGRASLREKT